MLALLIGGPFAAWCVGLMGCPVGSPLHLDALAYGRTRALALPAALALSASEGIFRGMGNTRAPLRAALLGVFLLSLGGMPGTLGFVSRFRILASLEHGGHRIALVAGLAATVLALSAVGRPLLAMMRPDDGGQSGSRALSNEQLVLLVCGVITVYFGVSPIVGETNMAGQLAIWIERAVGALR